MIPVTAYIALAALLVGAVGGWQVTSWHDKAGQVTAIQRAKAEMAQQDDLVIASLRKQLTDTQSTLTRNQEINRDLQAQNDAVMADRDTTRGLVKRLLAEAARPAAAAHSLPETSGGPGPAPAGGAASNDEIAGLLTDAAGECQRNANRLDALSAEIKPQL